MHNQNVIIISEKLHVRPLQQGQKYVRNTISTYIFKNHVFHFHLSCHHSKHDRVRAYVSRDRVEKNQSAESTVGSIAIFCSLSLI